MIPIFLFIGDKICLNIPNIPCIFCSWTPLPFKILKSCVVIRQCMWLWTKVTIVKILKKNPYWHQNLAFLPWISPTTLYKYTWIRIHSKNLLKFCINIVFPVLKQGFRNYVKGLGEIRNFTGRWFFYWVVGTVILTIRTLFKAKNNFL